MNNQKITPSELKALRTVKGISQVRLAKDAGLQRSYLSQYENGKYLFSDDDLDSIMKALDRVDDVNDPELPTLFDLALDPVILVGFLVPGGVEPEECELALEKFEDAMSEVMDRLNLETPRGFFGGVDREALSRHLLDAGMDAIDAMRWLGEVRGRDHFNFSEGTVGAAFVERFGA
jgi:transcriptional regulator with XRE-family HTH domain